MYVSLPSQRSGSWSRLVSAHGYQGPDTAVNWHTLPQPRIPDDDDVRLAVGSSAAVRATVGHAAMPGFARSHSTVSQSTILKLLVSASALSSPSYGGAAVWAGPTQNFGWVHGPQWHSVFGPHQ